MIRPTCCMPWLRDTLPKTLVAMTSRTRIRVLRTALRLSELTAATGSGEKVCMLQEYLWSRQKLHYAGSPALCRDLFLRWFSFVSQCKGRPSGPSRGRSLRSATSCSVDLTPARLRLRVAGRRAAPTPGHEGTSDLDLCFGVIQAAIALA